MPPIIQLSEPWPAFVTGAGREQLAHGALAPYVTAQRWFPAKTRTLSAVAVEEAVALDPAGESTLLLIAVDYADGGRHRFAMPIALATGEAAARVSREAPARIIAEVSGQVFGLLHDDMAEGLASRLLDAVQRQAVLEGADGTLWGEPTAAFADLRGPDAELPARRITAEQSNTSVIFGDRLIMKVIRRLEPGLNPDYEIGRHLTDAVRFPGVPSLAGALLWRTPGADPIVLAIVQALVPKAAVMRERLVARLVASLRRWDGQGVRPSDTSMRADVAGDRDEARALGRRTGALHLALADARGDEAFAPEPVSGADLRTIAEDMQSHTAGAIDLLAGRLGDLPPDSRGVAAAIVARRAELLAAVGRVAAVAPGLARIRVHGDYQLDQVLVAGDEFVVIDFEGEPLRPLSERRAKFLALKDIAGMLRSFSYAAYAAIFEAAGDDAGRAGRLEPAARWWQEEVGRAFVEGYRESVGTAAFVPADDADFAVLLQAFIVEKAAYELRYELNHRPAWLRIPLRGVAGLLAETRGTWGSGDLGT